MSNRPLKDAIAKKLESEWAYNPKSKYWNKNMKPSFLGTSCLRKIYYCYNRVKPDYGWTAQKIENFEKGDMFHNLIKSWFKGLGVSVPYRNKKGEIPKHWKTKEPDPEFPVSAKDLHIKNAKIDDVLILEGIDGIKDGLWLAEYKSINQKGYDRYIETGPKDEHLQQAMTYVYLFEQNLADGEFDHIEELEGFTQVNGIIYVYINRETDDTEDNWKEFVVEKDEEPFLEVADKIFGTLKHVEEGTLPDKTEDFCNWCDFREKCKKEKKGI